MGIYYRAAIAAHGSEGVKSKNYCAPKTPKRQLATIKKQEKCFDHFIYQ